MSGKTWWIINKKKTYISQIVFSFYAVFILIHSTYIYFCLFICLLNFPDCCVIWLWEVNHRTCDCWLSTLTTLSPMQLAAAYISCSIDFLCSWNLQKIFRNSKTVFFSCESWESQRNSFISVDYTKLHFSRTKYRIFSKSFCVLPCYFWQCWYERNNEW